ncbi:hypothetical protein NBRC110019_28760 [Neptunitalea chrysea]|uniref:Peptidyl-prolyl cis-trans isomerase n=1 Tax=Neptunitalea chrysea TaxID=1647581 RepID=A0A9W6B8N8_9FLAO|nr:gliding motility-associated peptidyl-prolyl isomerase GldI [Neptunitalea chrysea]GLB53835.1 hypothetical protein NBRC110019_28760 [Neptunitalea chrysea]
MKKYILIIGILSFLVSCSEPEPRKPVTSKTGTFFKESVKRNKLILEKEENYIQQLIKADSLNNYIPSKDGFWYTYGTKDSLSSNKPVEDDLVTLTYNIKSLNNQNIYSFDAIGTVTYKVDKQENLFFGLRKAVKLLHKGEEATFYFPSSLAYGYIGDHKRIGVNIPLKSTLKIIDIEKSNDSITTNN